MLSVPHLAGADKVRTLPHVRGDDPPRPRVYTEVIPPSLTGGPRAVRWCPAGALPVPWDGLLEVQDKGRARVYRVTEFVPDAPWFGRAFRAEKCDGADTYTVLLAADGSNHLCDCAAGTYRRVAECCHVAALKAVLLNGWLDDPRADPRPDGWPPAGLDVLADDVPF